MFSGLWWPKGICEAGEISVSERFLMVEIFTLKGEDGCCFAGNSHFARRLGVLPRQVRKHLESLANAGLVEISQSGGRAISLTPKALSLFDTERPHVIQTHPEPEIEAEPEAKPAKKQNAREWSKTDALRMELPDCVPNDVWETFVDLRWRIKKPLSERAAKRAIDKLVKFAQQGQDIAAIVDNSDFNNWQDLYPPKEQKNGRQGSRTMFNGLVVI